MLRLKLHALNDMTDVAYVAAELGYERGPDFDARAAVVRLGRAARLDPLFMEKMRDVAQSIRLRLHIQRTHLRGLPRLEPILDRIEQDAETILDVASAPLA